MDSADTQYYHIGLSDVFECVLERKSEDWLVTVFSKNRPVASMGEPILLLTEDSYSKEYETPPYKTEHEAYIHAYGWVDCGFCNQADPDTNEESWKNAYNKLKEKYEEFCKIALSSAAEEAYKAGWKKRWELKNMDGEVGD